MSDLNDVMNRDAARADRQNPLTQDKHSDHITGDFPCPFCGSKLHYDDICEDWNCEGDGCLAIIKTLQSINKRSISAAIAVCEAAGLKVFGPNDIKNIADRFLSWEMPKSVCADLCACDPNYIYKRYGTNLLDASQSASMVRHILGLEAK